MLNHCSKKSGFTLIEVVIVVAIMGVLSTMGYSGLKTAVNNARMKDYSLNLAAFLERIGNDATRMSKEFCVKMATNNEQELLVFEPVDGSCNVDNPSELYDVFNLESPAKFGCGSASGSGSPDWAKNGAKFVPRIGLSAAPSEGYICMQYGVEFVYGLIEKKQNTNSIVPRWRTGELGDYWSDDSWYDL